MAWRLTPAVSCVANSTVITADLLNKLQVAINDLFLGNYSVRKLWIDGTGDLTAAAISNGALRVATGVTVDAGGITVTAGGATITAGNVAVNSGTLSVSGNITSTGGNIAASAGTLSSSGDISSSGGKLSLGLARSSATPGAGQSVAVGAAYSDTLNFATGRFTVGGGAITVVRSANIASMVYTSPGVYTITLQTAAPNAIMNVGVSIDDTGTPFMCGFGITSTSVFVIRIYSTAPAAADPPGVSFTVTAG